MGREELPVDCAFHAWAVSIGSETRVDPNNAPSHRLCINQSIDSKRTRNAIEFYLENHQLSMSLVYIAFI